MSVGAALSTIGLVADVLGIWGFAEGQIPASQSGTTTYRVAVGLDGTNGPNGKLSDAGGTIESIRSYNGNGNLIGVGNMQDKINSGGYGDATVGQGEVKQQAMWTNFFAGDDASCIAYITAQWDDSQKWGWTGDWGYYCGLVGYPSGIKLQNSKGVGGPRCMWVDKDHSNDIKAAIIGIYWPAFTKDTTDGVDALSLCGAGEGLSAWTEAGSVNVALPHKRKRSGENTITYPGRMDERLVVSPLSWHNATEECANPLTYGPDFVSTHEGVYCDMDTRQTLPLCGSHTDTGGQCFDLEAARGKPPASRRRRRGIADETAALGEAVTKTPTSIVDFEH